MAWSDFPGAAVVEARAERAWRVPMGAVSPLWAMFGAAAGAGVAYWWLTQWTRAVNVEALAGLTLPRAPKPQRIEIVAEPVAAPAPEPPTIAELAAEPEAAAAEAVAHEAVFAGPGAPESVLAESAVAEPAAEAAQDQGDPDDLTAMNGIGPKLAAALAERGVTRFAQIAAWTAADLAEVDAALSLKGRAVREAWVEQAKRLAKAR
jgi:predicted flap endonuclease-1-like 5' DNA nuclease